MSINNSRIGVSYMDPACLVKPRLGLTDLNLNNNREYSGDEAGAVAAGYASLLDSVVNHEMGPHDMDFRPGKLFVKPELEVCGLKRDGTASAEYDPQTGCGTMQLEGGPISLKIEYASAPEAERFRQHPSSAAMLPSGREQHFNIPTRVTDTRTRDDGQVERREVVLNANGTFTVIEGLL